MKSSEKESTKIPAKGVPLMAQRKQTQLLSMRTRVWSLGSLSGLRIYGFYNCFFVVFYLFVQVCLSVFNSLWSCTQFSIQYIYWDCDFIYLFLELTFGLLKFLLFYIPYWSFFLFLVPSFIYLEIFSLSFYAIYLALIKSEVLGNLILLFDTSLDFPLWGPIFS